jgi:hypothetical protein
VALSPISLGRHIPWNSAAVLGLVPMVAMMGVLMRALYSSLTRQEATAARETLLARTGSKLLNRTDAREAPRRPTTSPTGSAGACWTRSG